MRAWEIDIPKPPDDKWTILVDFTERLDTAGGEELQAVDVSVYKLYSYDEVISEFSLTDALRFNLEIEKVGEVTDRYSWPVLGQPSLELRFPKTYPKERVLGIVPPESIVIGPSDGTPPNTKVSFLVQGGENDSVYAIYVIADTNKGRRHSCVIRMRVAEIELTE